MEDYRLPCALCDGTGLAGMCDACDGEGYVYDTSGMNRALAAATARVEALETALEIAASAIRKIDAMGGLTVDVSPDTVKKTYAEMATIALFAHRQVNAARAALASPDSAGPEVDND